VSADHRSLEAVPDLGSAAASGTPARFFFITRGLPGCGKSTFAKRFVRTYDGRIARINRDMWRDMTERAVDVGAHAAVRHLLADGWDVICDNTYLSSEDMAAAEQIAADCGARLVVFDFRHVPLEVCIEQDARRRPGDLPHDGRRWGADYIRDLHEKYIAAVVAS
jgi:predicted kinase